MDNKKQTAHEQKRVYNTEEAAKYLALGASTVKNSRYSGELLGNPAPKFTKLGGRVVYLKEQLDDWLNNLPQFANTVEAELYQL